MIKERPILLAAPMVRAILDGRKTLTRRLVKIRKERGEWEASTIGGAGVKHPDGTQAVEQACIWNTTTGTVLICPYGSLGDRLWVRETWHPESSKIDGSPAYKADVDYDTRDCKWKPSIHMPRSASRILLEITNVRVDKLQNISEDDAIAEGIQKFDIHSSDARMEKSTVYGTDSKTAFGFNYVNGYQNLWESIHGEYSWDLNPWVWVVEFKVIENGK